MSYCRPSCPEAVEGHSGLKRWEEASGQEPNEELPEWTGFAAVQSRVSPVNFGEVCKKLHNQSLDPKRNDPKSTTNRPQNDPKSTPNRPEETRTRPENDQKTTRKRPENDQILKFGRFLVVFWSFSGRFLVVFWSFSGRDESRGGRILVKIGSREVSLWSFCGRFGVNSWSFCARFLVVLGIFQSKAGGQNVPKEPCAQQSLECNEFGRGLWQEQVVDRNRVKSSQQGGQLMEGLLCNVDKVLSIRMLLESNEEQPFAASLLEVFRSLDLESRSWSADCSEASSL